jgi:tRNA U38,U39,U40 pseudouridine synthase TruA
VEDVSYVHYYNHVNILFLLKEAQKTFRGTQNFTLFKRDLDWKNRIVKNILLVDFNLAEIQLIKKNNLDSRSIFKEMFLYLKDRINYQEEV